jgi:hypothetical protein
MIGKKKKINKSDLVTYLSQKSEANNEMKERELEFRNRALEIETELKKETIALEMKKLEVQEKQIAMQFETLKSFMSKFSKED